MRSTTFTNEITKFCEKYNCNSIHQTYFFPISLYARHRFFILFPLSPNAQSNKYLTKYRSVCVPTQYAFRVKRTMHIVILLCTYGFFLFDVSPFDKLPFYCRVPNNCQLSIKRPRRPADAKNPKSCTLWL